MIGDLLGSFYVLILYRTTSTGACTALGLVIWTKTLLSRIAERGFLTNKRRGRFICLLSHLLYNGPQNMKSSRLTVTLFLRNANSSKRILIKSFSMNVTLIILGRSIVLQLVLFCRKKLRGRHFMFQINSSGIMIVSVRRRFHRLKGVIIVPGVT